MEIYDDEIFFENYLKLRQSPKNYNDNFEQPIILGLVGDCTDLSVLDIGCGYGNTCVALKNKGAKNVLGIDVSQKMLDFAIERNQMDGIRFLHLGADDLDSLDEKFDLIVSSLALHYVEDFSSVVKKAFSLLNENGRFIFSIEHPIYTATEGHLDLWLLDEDDSIVAYALDNYSKEGIRQIEWLGKKITKYHRTTASIVCSLIDNGLSIEKLLEPTPSAELMNANDIMKRELHRPAYLIISSKKQR